MILDVRMDMGNIPKILHSAKTWMNALSKMEAVISFVSILLEDTGIVINYHLFKFQKNSLYLSP